MNMWARKTHGFTIVELLIVIVVIAILAAITIVAYTGIQDRAVETAVKADFSNFAKKMELYRADSTSESYPTSFGQFTSALGISFSKDMYFTGGTGNNVLYCHLSGGTGWALVAGDKSGRGWSATNQSSVQPYSGSGVLSTGLGSQTVVCPAISGGSNANNAWAYTGSTWQAWVN